MLVTSTFHARRTERGRQRTPADYPLGHDRKRPNSPLDPDSAGYAAGTPWRSHEFGGPLRRASHAAPLPTRRAGCNVRDARRPRAACWIADWGSDGVHGAVAAGGRVPRRTRCDAPRTLQGCAACAERARVLDCGVRWRPTGAARPADSRGGARAVTHSLRRPAHVATCATCAEHEQRGTVGRRLAYPHPNRTRRARCVDSGGVSGDAGRRRVAHASALQADHKGGRPW